MKRKRSILGMAVVVLFTIAMAVQAQEAISNYLYSTDIGSDLDISDPVTPPGSMDAGAIYTPRGGPGNPLLWKDDDSPTPFWPGYPFSNAPQPQPHEIGTSGIDMYHTYFDLDAEDQVLSGVSIGQVSTLDALRLSGVYSIYNPTRLSYDDDGPNGWAVSGDVPTTAAPDRAIEIHGTWITPPPVGPASSVPLIDEVGLQLDPNPPGQNFDDDVDALDWHPLIEDPNDPMAFKARYFSPDHEADLGLDPGDIYLTLRNGGQPNVTMAFDDVMNFGVSDETDIDAFEFVAIDDDWAALFGIVLQPDEWITAAIFSVDQDDLDTPLIDESGGLNPNVIYLSDLLGNYVAATGDYGDDIDALTVIPEPATMALIGLFGGGMLFIRRFLSM